MTPAKLRKQTSKELAKIAREAGIAGWHSMRKEELIQAIASDSRSRPALNSKSAKRAARTQPAKRPTAGSRRAAERRDRQQTLGDLGTSTDGGGDNGDQLLLMVRDPYWLHATWRLAAETITRARTALGQNWHGSKPELRVLSLTPDGVVLGARRIAIHGGVNHWYIDVSDPPNRFRAEIGYASHNGSFYCLARSTSRHA